MTDILTNDEISLLRSLEKKSRTIIGNFHSQALRPLGDERLYQALIANPEHAGHAVRDNRRREGCAEGCGGPLRLK